MTKLKNTKKGMAKKALSVSLVAAMLATSNVPVWAAEDLFSDGNAAVEAPAAEVETFGSEPAEEVTADAPALQAADYQANLNASEISVNGDITASFVGVAVGSGEGSKYSVNWYITEEGESIASGSALAEVDAAHTFIGSSNPLNEGTIEVKFSNRENDSIPLTTSDIGKYLTVVLYEDKNAGIGDPQWETVTNSVSVPIVKGDVSDYVSTFVESVEWGTPLNKSEYKSYATINNAILDENSLKWVCNNADVADGYVTQSTDIGKTYTLVGTVNIGDSTEKFENIALGTVTITAQDATTDIYQLIWEDDVTTDANGNPTYTYDGTAHYPKLEAVVLENGDRIDASSAVYTQLTQSEATEANTGITYTITIPETDNYKAITISKKLYINPVNLTTDGTLTVANGFEYNKAGTYTITDAEGLSKAGLSVTVGGKALTLTDDYTVSVIATPKNEVGSSNAQVTITGKDNYTGTLRVQAPITAKELADGNIELAYDDVVYDGNAKEPEVTVTDDTIKLVKGTDYTVSYSDNKEVGNATVTVTGIGNYTGVVNKTFKITAASLEDLKGFLEKDLEDTRDAGGTTYTGKAIDFVDDAYNNLRFVKNRDFTVEYVPQNVNAGKVRLEVQGIGNYEDADTIEIEFDILQRNLNDEDVKVDLKGLTYDQDITEDEIKEALTITYNGMTLVEKSDYEVKVGNRNGNKVSIELKGIGNYTGTRTETVTMAEKDINTVTLPKIDAQEYTGKSFTLNNDGSKIVNNGTPVADFVIKDGDYELELGKDYAVVNYENNTNVGTATINIAGRGAYTGTASISFPIVEQELTGSIVMNGSPIIPDQQYSYEKVTKFGGYTFTFDESLSANKLTVVDENGNGIDPDNYTVSYKDNTAAGTATITVEGKEGYDLYAVNTFRIVPAKLSEIVSGDPLKLDDAKLHYTGEGLEPEATVTLKDSTYTLVEGTDYEVVYSDNINAGNGKATVVGLGNYAGSMSANEIATNNLEEEFTIEKADIRPSDVSALDVPYAGGLLVDPAITITNRYSGKELVEDTDYTIEITEGGSDIGQVTAEIKLTAAAAKNYEFTEEANTGEDNYEVTFDVVAQDLADVEISPIADQAVTGEQIRPAIVVMNGQARMVEGYDYEVTYGENTEVGTGTVTITPVEGSKTYVGSQEVTFNIVDVAPEVGGVEISNVRVSGNTVTPILSGEADGAVGYDYVLSTSDDVTDTASRIDVSKNKLTTNTSFYYVEEGTYYVYCHAWKRDENGLKVFGAWSNAMPVEVTATTPATPTIVSAKLNGKNLTVTWTQCDNATGYDIVMGKAARKVNGEMRPVDYGKAVKKITNGNTVSVTFRGIPAGTYYVGLHAWNRTSETGVKVFSPWSNGKKIVVR